MDFINCLLVSAPAIQTFSRVVCPKKAYRLRRPSSSHDQTDSVSTGTQFSTAAHWGHSECASWPFAHYVLRARNGNLRNGNARNGNGVNYVMSLPYGDGEPREGGGGETRTIYMCGHGHAGRLDIIACLCTRY